MSSVLNPYSSQNHPVRGRLGHPDSAGRRWLQCGEKEGQLKVHLPQAIASQYYKLLEVEVHEQRKGVNGAMTAITSLKNKLVKDCLAKLKIAEAVSLVMADSFDIPEIRDWLRTYEKNRAMEKIRDQNANNNWQCHLLLPHQKSTIEAGSETLTYTDGDGYNVTLSFRQEDLDSGICATKNSGGRTEISSIYVALRDPPIKGLDALALTCETSIGPPPPEHPPITPIGSQVVIGHLWPPDKSGWRWVYCGRGVQVLLSPGVAYQYSVLLKAEESNLWNNASERKEELQETKTYFLRKCRKSKPAGCQPIHGIIPAEESFALPRDFKSSTLANLVCSYEALLDRKDRERAGRTNTAAQQGGEPQPAALDRTQPTYATCQQDHLQPAVLQTRPASTIKRSPLLTCKRLPRPPSQQSRGDISLDGSTCGTHSCMCCPCHVGQISD